MTQAHINHEVPTGFLAIRPESSEKLSANDPASPAYDGRFLDEVLVHGLPPRVLAGIMSGAVNPFEGVMVPEEGKPGSYMLDQDRLPTAFVIGKIVNAESGQSTHFPIKGFTIQQLLESI